MEICLLEKTRGFNRKASLKVRDNLKKGSIKRVRLIWSTVNDDNLAIDFCF